MSLSSLASVLFTREHNGSICFTSLCGNEIRHNVLKKIMPSSLRLENDSNIITIPCPTAQISRKHRDGLSLWMTSDGGGTMREGTVACALLHPKLRMDATA